MKQMGIIALMLFAGLSAQAATYSTPLSKSVCDRSEQIEIAIQAAKEFATKRWQISGWENYAVGVDEMSEDFLNEKSRELTIVQVELVEAKQGKRTASYRVTVSGCEALRIE